MPSASTQLGDVEILREARRYYTGIGKTRDYEKAFSMLLPLAKEDMQRRLVLWG